MRFFSRWIHIQARHRKLSMELREARREVEIFFRLETLVNDITTRFINLTSEKYDGVINSLLRDIGKFIGIDRAYLFIVTGDREFFSMSHEWRAKGIKATAKGMRCFPADHCSWWRRGLVSRKYIHIPSPDDVPPGAETERRFMNLGSVHSMLLVPLIRKGLLDGFLGFDAVRSRKIWDKKEIYLLESVAQNIMNLRLRWETERELRTAETQLIKLREEDLETSARIQRTILTGDPNIRNPAVDIRALTIPSQEVDGDFYNTVRVSNDAFDILSGDVMGKGLPGAFIAAAVRNHFLQVKLNMAMSQPRGILPGPRHIVNAVASRITPELIHLESFIALTYSRVNVRFRRLDFVDCGHTPVIHLRCNTQRCWRLKGHSSPLGFLENETHKEQSVAFYEGDILFFYSDGISEARNQQGDFFGEQRLITIIEKNYDRAMTEIISVVKAAVINFCEGNPLADDLTCVAVKLHDLPGGWAVRRERIFPGEMSSLAAVRSFIGECIDADPGAAISSAEKARIIFAGNEAASNIITHGVSRDDGEEPAGFYLEAGINSGWLSLCFLYGGKPFSLPPAERPDIESMQEHGYGIFIMEEFMDSITYADDARGGRMIALAKRFDI
ncbi:MAG: SpoIIE family protein phosphatase [Spirochaetales bacterium]|jgi:sigma-B regulation protein RsbU (phosphoserine phosphatase)|nr:SpoIIE family protein phosphatase [Spirochaetales bacterium]